MRNNGKAYEAHCIRKMRRRLWLFVRQCGNTNRPDFGADIIAWGLFGRIVVQCKCYSKPVGIKAIQEVHAARQYYGTRRAAVATNSTFTRQAKQLAKKCRVKLWERY